VQLKKRQADARKQMAQTNLHAVLVAEDVEVLRTTAEAAWRSEGDLERLRAMAVHNAIAAHHATLVRIRAMKNVGELRQLGLEVVETAGMDALCAIPVETVVRDCADVNVGRRSMGRRRWSLIDGWWLRRDGGTWRRCGRSWRRGRR
jgi:hypothetical protein